MALFDRIRTEQGRIEDMTAMGVTKIGTDTVQVSVWRQGASKCDLCIYSDNQKQIYPMFPAREQGMSDYFTLCLREKNITEKLQGLCYDFVAEGVHFVDPYARGIAGRDLFGRKPKQLRGRFDFEEFDWSSENWQKIAAPDMILYQCHVRGFTRHSSSGVTYPGTFSGMQEKIPYLKELGVNTLLLLPVYDFNEWMQGNDGAGTKKINYWGYENDAFYFAPKAGYASREKSSPHEFQQLVKTLHQNGMNLLLDMHFTDQTPTFILACLHYYALRFHVDGFRINQKCLDANWLRQDPVLSHVKLLGHNFREQPEQPERLGQENLMEMNDDFLVDARRFLKSDEGQAANFYHRFWEQKRGVGLVHCITQHNGFTLRDLISYDVKHNEDNGEKNQDGTEYNYSWNCGVEGPSRRKEVLRKRACQEKNAFVMLLLGIAAPMILAGDEFGNTQKGNNNAYCQDNAITWLDWRMLEKNRETFAFVKQLIGFRKSHPLYQMRHSFTGMDLKGLGMPDVSCHGKEPWDVKFSYYCREVGILFYGGYFGGKSLYFAFNFHWENHVFFLPDAGTGKKWNLILDTAGDSVHTRIESKYDMAPRSIALFEKEPEQQAGKGKKKAQKGRRESKQSR